MTNETLEVIKARRSVRKYTSQQVSDEQLNAILEAGLYAPTGRGTQDIAIVAIQDPEDIKTVSRLNIEAIGLTEGNPYKDSPTIVLIFAVDPYTQEMAVLDGGAACENMLIAAKSLGLDTCWVHRTFPAFESEAGRKLLKKWGLPEHARGVASFSLGYADGPAPKAVKRKEGRVFIIK